MANVSKQSIAEMTGELLREAGVLVLVFYPIREGPGGAFSKGATIISVLVALGSWAGGAVIERRRTT